MRKFISQCRLNILYSLQNEGYLTQSEIIKATAKAHIIQQQHDRVSAVLASFSLPMAFVWLEYVAVPRVVKRQIRLFLVGDITSKNAELWPRISKVPMADNCQFTKEPLRYQITSRGKKSILYHQKQIKRNIL